MSQRHLSLHHHDIDLSVTLTQTEPSKGTVTALDGNGVRAEVTYGEKFNVSVAGDVIGHISHDVGEVEVASMIFMRESWSAHSADYSKGSVGNIASESAAVRMLLSLHRRN